jgi:hypothetical protein
MPWFKIDDGFHSHPKVAQLFEGPCPGDAIALFSLAGSWVSRELTDGAVPLGFVRRSGLHPEAAAELVRVGLWEDNPGGGYWIHDYLQYNPDREQVLADREKNRERQARWYAKQQKGRPDPNGPPNGGPNGVRNTVTNTVMNGDLTGAPVPVPVPREEIKKPPPARAREEQNSVQVGHDLMFTATGRPYNPKDWRDELDRIGMKPAAERGAVIAAIQADPWCKGNRGVDPKHVIKNWDKYAAGYVPLKAVVRAQPARFAGPSRVATAAEYEADKTEKAPWE